MDVASVNLDGYWGSIQFWNPWTKEIPNIYRSPVALSNWWWKTSEPEMHFQFALLPSWKSFGQTEATRKFWWNGNDVDFCELYRKTLACCLSNSQVGWKGTILENSAPLFDSSSEWVRVMHPFLLVAASDQWQHRLTYCKRDVGSPSFFPRTRTTARIRLNKLSQILPITKVLAQHSTSMAGNHFRVLSVACGMFRTRAKMRTQNGHHSHIHFGMPFQTKIYNISLK